jgi:hypothetical protein
MAGWCWGGDADVLAICRSATSFLHIQLGGRVEPVSKFISLDKHFYGGWVGGWNQFANPTAHKSHLLSITTTSSFFIVGIENRFHPSTLIKNPHKDGLFMRVVAVVYQLSRKQKGPARAGA